MLFGETPESFLLQGEAPLSTSKKQEEAFISKAYDIYSPGLFSYILQIVPDKVKAGEILVSVFVKAYNTIGINIKCTLFIWFLNTARNEAVEALIEIYCGTRFVTINSGNLIVDNRALQRFLVKLPVIEKTILSLIYLRGYGLQDISDLLKLPIHVVESKMDVAKQKLQTTYPSFSLTTAN